MRVGSGHITDKEHETSSSFMLFCDARPETSSSIIYPVLKDMQTERHAMRRTAAFAADSFPLPACPPGAAALRSGPHVGKPRLPPKTSLKKKAIFPGTAGVLARPDSVCTPLSARAAVLRKTARDGVPLSVCRGQWLRTLLRTKSSGFSRTTRGTSWMNIQFCTKVKVGIDK